MQLEPSDNIEKFVKQCYAADMTVEETELAYLRKFASEIMRDPHFKEGFSEFIKLAGVPPDIVENYINTDNIGYSILAVASQLQS